MPEIRPPVPPFDADTALQKVRAAEAAWNTRDPERVAGAYTADSVWRNRDEFINGREEIVAFLARKWSKELDYVLRKDLWVFDADRIAVRFQYEWHDAMDSGSARMATSSGSSPTTGLMRRREASINDAPIDGPSVGSAALARPATRPGFRSDEPLRRAAVALPGQEPGRRAVESAEISDDGVAGDRLVHVRGPEGVRHIAPPAPPPRAPGTLAADGTPLIDGLPWSSPEALALVREAAGADAQLVAYDGTERFDVLPLLVATDGAVAEFGRDVRRLRPEHPDRRRRGAGRTRWPGATLRIGDAVIDLDSLRARCPMTTVDPDTLERDPGVLKDIGRRFGGRLALNADVLAAGTIHVGDAVELIPAATGIAA